LAIFLLVLLQEIGMPNPFPNELVLIFSGYLSFKGILFLPLIILTVLSADFIGANILYFLFYNAGTFIMKKKPSWFPLSSGMIDRLSSKISKGGVPTIYIFRLTPFTRGYTSVIAGLLQVKPKIFLPVALFSGLTWATAYIVIGNLIGPSWNLFTQNIDSFRYYMLAALVIIICAVLLIYGFRKKGKNKINAIVNNS
jgi:membrane protein DedA with SNARE-associated domain